MSYIDDVLDVTRMIPEGRVTTYGAIADYLSLGSARMVGWALSKYCDADVPAHRVVNRKGVLTGKRNFNPPEKMVKLLEKENVIIENDKVLNFNLVYWHPEEIII